MSKLLYFKHMKGWLFWPMTLLLVVLWAGAVFAATLNGWGHESLAPAGDSAAFLDAAKREIAGHRGAAAVRLIEGGQTFGEVFVSANADTIFPVASVSKWVTAWGVLALVDEGKLDLDAPVDRYLRRWKLPESGFDNEQVTVRRLLSHTAGLTDGLGYAGFATGAEVQSIEDSLTQAADASPGADGRVRVGARPGAEWRYSGGGYTLLQLLIEEITGSSFRSHMSRAVFEPLGMTRSSFELDAADQNAAASHDLSGARVSQPRFTALAATSLYSSATDMSRFIQAHSFGPNGEPAGRGVLRPETLRLMRRPHASRWGVEIWGLGTILFVPHRGDFIIGHDGTNEPAINAAVRLDPGTGDGIVVLETGDRTLATRLAGEWVRWKTGKIDLLMFTFAAQKMSIIIGLGALCIVAGAAALRFGPRRGGPKF